MPWRGFVVEGKSFMNYEKMDKVDKIKFWLYYPIAWWRFHIWDFRGKI